MIQVKIRLLSKDAVVPTKAHPQDAAFDLYTPRDYSLMVGRQTLQLDFALEIPDGYCAKIKPRSGFASKGLEATPVYNASPCRINADVLDGLIDSNYRGNVCVIVNNHDNGYRIPKGTRIAQMLIERVEDVQFTQADTLNDSDRQDTGFGASGTH
jgi:dUTP pyrophosphatase